MIRPTACVLYRYHRPKPWLIEYHHIQPLGMGGLDIIENKVAVCTNCHYAIHGLLSMILRADKSIGQTIIDSIAILAVVSGYRSEKMYAIQGYKVWIGAGRPGKPVYEA